MEKYLVVAEKEIARFRERCNYEMNNGYIPVGGLVKTSHEFFQSFILDEKKEEVPKNIPPKKKAGRPRKDAGNIKLEG